jgi:hypothetical protein
LQTTAFQTDAIMATADMLVTAETLGTKLHLLGGSLLLGAAAYRNAALRDANQVGGCLHNMWSVSMQCRAETAV